MLLIFLGSSSASIILAQPVEKVPVIIGFRSASDVGLVQSFGGEIKYVYHYILAIAASLPPQAIDALQKNPNVAYVETDFEAQMLTQTTSWGIQKIRAPDVWPAFGDKGAGIRVAVADTGIDTTHPDLKVAGGVTYVFGTKTYNDDNGHGTHVAGIVAALDNDIGVVGVAPEASLYAVKVLNSQGSGFYSDINSGIEWSISHGMQVISMSFGGPDSASLHAECDKAYSNGIVLVAAAGNSGPGDNTILAPAMYSSVIAVGATDSTDAIASFSSRGPQLSVAAPGVNIYSTYKAGTYATLSGTSMACPHVTGTVALILKASAHTPAEVRNILQKTAVDLGPAGWDSMYGYGRIDAYAATAASGTPTPPTKPSPPQNLKAAAGNGQVTLSWSAPSSDGGSAITNYNIYKGDAPGMEGQVATIGNELTYTDTTVTNGQTYYYQVTAVNSVGESDKSNEVSATPSGTQPTLTVKVSTDKTSYQRNSWVIITVTVTDNIGNGLGGATVTISVIGPKLASSTGTTDSTGRFVYRFRANRAGTYTVLAQATKTGYIPGTGSTSFTVT